MAFNFSVQSEQACQSAQYPSLSRTVLCWILPLTSFLLCMHSSLSTTNALLNILSKQYMHFYLPTFIVTEKGKESRQTTSAAMLSWEIHIWKKCGVPEIYCCRLWNQRSSRFIFKNNTKKKQSRPVRSSSVLWLF